MSLVVSCAVPLRDGLLYGEIVGAGPDVVFTLWGMWWFQQEMSILGWGQLYSQLPIWCDRKRFIAILSNFVCEYRVCWVLAEVMHCVLGFRYL